MTDFSREAMLVGEEGLARLAASRVAVFGVGGVGGYVCEALARAGMGALDLFDPDIIAPSNLNRQLVALHSTLGQKKADVMAARILDINPDCKVSTHPVFYLPENANDFPLEIYDYVVDAVDTVSAKLELAARAHAAGVPIISSMGTGNKLRPESFHVVDINQTSICPLARVMRRELRKRGIPTLWVVCSDEAPRKPCGPPGAEAASSPTSGRRDTPGSISFVPGAAGLVAAGWVVRGLLGLM